MEPNIRTLPGVVELLKQSLNFYKNHYKQLMWIGVIPFLIYTSQKLVSTALIGSGNPSVTAGMIFVLLAALFGIFNIVFQLVTQTAFVKGVKDLDEGTPVSTNELYKTGFRLFLPYFWVTILYTIISMGSSVLLIIPGIIVGGYLIFINYTTILEGKRGLAALTTSFYYVRGNWWKVFWRLLGCAVIFGFVVLVVVAIPVLVILLLNGGMTQLGMESLLKSDSVEVAFGFIGILFSFAYYCIALPIFIYPSYVLYKNLKTAKPEPVPETDLKEPHAWFLGLSIWGAVVGFLIALIMILTMVAAFTLGALQGYWEAKHASSTPTPSFETLE